MKNILPLCIATVCFITGTPAQQNGVTSEALLRSIPKTVNPTDGYSSGGTVRVRVSVDEKGIVTDAVLVSGPGAVCGWVTRLDVVKTRETAVALARQARFHPARNGGVPVAATAYIAIEFAAPKSKPNGEQKGEGITFVGPVVPTPNEKADAEKTAKSDSTVREAPKEMRLGVLTTSERVAPAPAPEGQSATAFPNELRTMISGAVLNGKAIVLPKPSYPAVARAVRASGVVHVQVLIDEDGSVFAAEAVSGHPLLRAASAKAACGSKFTPTLLDGDPVKVSGYINYNFVP